MAKLITVSQNLLEDLLPYLKGTKYDDKIQALLDNTNKYLTQDITYFPKKGRVERVVDGDTIVLTKCFHCNYLPTSDVGVQIYSAYGAGSE